MEGNLNKTAVFTVVELEKSREFADRSAVNLKVPKCAELPGRAELNTENIFKKGQNN